MQIKIIFCEIRNIFTKNCRIRSFFNSFNTIFLSIETIKGIFLRCYRLDSRLQYKIFLTFAEYYPHRHEQHTTLHNKSYTISASAHTAYCRYYMPTYISYYLYGISMDMYSCGVWCCHMDKKKEPIITYIQV